MSAPNASHDKAEILSAVIVAFTAPPATKQLTPVEINGPETNADFSIFDILIGVSPYKVNASAMGVTPVGV